VRIYTAYQDFMELSGRMIGWLILFDDARCRWLTGETGGLDPQNEPILSLTICLIQNSYNGQDVHGKSW
jgi:hypothetical protein